jgi:hypothetical protein
MINIFLKFGKNIPFVQIMDINDLFCDSYSIYLKSINMIIFNHAIKGLSNITQQDYEKIIKKNWKQNDLFNVIIHKKETIKINYLDNEIRSCRLISYSPDKLFTDDVNLSVIQKGSISVIEII